MWINTSCVTTARNRSVIKISAVTFRNRIFTKAE